MPKIGLNKPNITSISKLEKFCKDDLYPWSHMYNGALISIDSIKKIGNLNPNYYMYGDEIDFFFRLRKVGSVLTHVKAYYFHPAVQKRPLDNIRIFYFIRNSIINYRKHYDKKLFRSTVGIIHLIYKIYKRNDNFKIIFSLLFGKRRKIFYTSIYQGMNNKLGINKEITQ